MGIDMRVPVAHAWDESRYYPTIFMVERMQRLIEVLLDELPRTSRQGVTRRLLFAPRRCTMNARRIRRMAAS